MTTTLATFADSAFSMRYKEPFITGGLNKKFAVALPSGAYRGFTLAVDSGGGDRTVNIAADPAGSDHVAVYLTETGYSLTVRRTGGDFLVDLSSYASEIVYVVIYATYALGATTTAVVRAYTEAEYAGASERDELVVLGKVDVPAATFPVTADLISDDLRTMPWRQRGAGTVPWEPLHKNAGFEWSDVVGAPYERSAADWRMTTTVGTAYLVPSVTSPNSGDKCVALDYTSGLIGLELYQPLFVPVVAERRIRIQLFKWMVQTETSGTATLVLRPHFLDSSGADVLGTDIVIDQAADPSYEEIDATFRVPSGLDITHLSHISVYGSGLSFGAPGDALRFDDFQVWLEATPEDWVPGRDLKGDLIASALQLREAGDDFGDRGENPLLRVVSDILRLERTDQKVGAAVVPASVELLGQLLNLGQNLLGSAAQAHTPRITSPVDEGVTQYTLLWEVKDSAAVNVVPLRIYAQSDVTGGLVIVTNASWNGSVWAQDLVAHPSMFYGFSGLISSILSQPAGSPPWGVWDNTRVYHGEVPGVASDWISGSTHFGEELRDTAAKAILPRLYARAAQSGVATYDRTLILEMPAYSSTVAAIRFYRADNSGQRLEVAFNAKWDGTEWGFDDSGSDATLMLFRDTGLDLYRYGGVGPWSELSWQRESAFVQGASNYVFLNDKYIRIANASANSNPANTIGVLNTLYAKGLVKSWIDCTTTGSGGVTTSNGLNATASISATRLRISFPGALANSLFAVATQVHSGGTLYHLTVAAKATGYVELQAWTGAGATYDLSANILSCMVTVLGEQN